MRLCQRLRVFLLSFTAFLCLGLIPGLHQVNRLEPGSPIAFADASRKKRFTRRKKEPKRDRAPAKTKPAVLDALDWLRRHQNKDGSWIARSFVKRCKKKCKNKDREHSDGRGFPYVDVGVTGLAMLAFLGYVENHDDDISKEYLSSLHAAARYLKRRQIRDKESSAHGRYSDGDDEPWIYEHAIATIAMVGVLNLPERPKGLKRSVRDAVSLCVKARNSGYGLALWRSFEAKRHFCDRMDVSRPARCV